MGSHAHWSGNNWYSQQGLMEWGMSSSKESEEGNWEHLLGRKKNTGHWSLLCVLCWAQLLRHVQPALWNPLDCSSPGSSAHGVVFRQEGWNRLPFPPTGDLSNPRIEPLSPVLPADSWPLSCQRSRVLLTESLLKSLSTSFSVALAKSLPLLSYLFSFVQWSLRFILSLLWKQCKCLWNGMNKLKKNTHIMKYNTVMKIASLVAQW